MNKKPLVIAAMVVGLLFGCDSSKFQSEVGEKIVSAINVKVRAEPSMEAPEVGRLGFGSVLHATQRTKEPSAVGGSSDYWYYVENGSIKGWVFGGLLTALDLNKAGESYVGLIRKRLGNPDVVLEGNQIKLTTEEAVEVAQFAKVAAPLLPDLELRGEVELAEWRAVQHAFAMSNPENKLNQTWLKSLGEKNVFFDEISGSWLVNADVYWQLADKYKTQKIGEMIAWQGANARLGGECEGDMSCASSAMQNSYGKYLQRYPTGKHAGATLQLMLQFFTGLQGDWANMDKDTRAGVDFKAWETILSNVPAGDTVNQIRAIMQKLKGKA